MLEAPFFAPEDLPAAVVAVRAALAEHGVVALPTETFYGLAADPEDPVAVGGVYALKGRPGEKALPVVGASLAQLAALASFPGPWVGRLEAAWPAPLTVVVPARRPTAAGGDTLAVRVPAHPLLRGLLAAVGPLTATSANRSGEPPATSPRAVATALGDGLALLLDGGETPGGAPTTLLDLTAVAPRLLRPGRWTAPPEWGVKVG
jgi:L-threonylcarbamoyladenylate synthase